LVRRLAARFEPGDEHVARLDRGHVNLVTSHGGSGKKAATLNTRFAKGQCVQNDKRDSSYFVLSALAVMFY
jgi:hypothetical protein